MSYDIKKFKADLSVARRELNPSIVRSSYEVVIRFMALMIRTLINILLRLEVPKDMIVLVEAEDVLKAIEVADVAIGEEKKQ